MKTAVIWGASGTGKSIYEKVRDEYEIIYFVDRNPELYEETINGINIYSPDHLLENCPDLIILGVLTGYADAIEWIISKEIPCENIISKYVDLSSRAREACLVGISKIFENNKITSGAVAELGVYRGDFAKVINKTFPDRKFYMFDTFEGFPELDIKYEKENGYLSNNVGKLSDTSIHLVLSKMPHVDNCIVKKGYFPETTEGIEEKFAFVNIDTDLYKPILSGLEWFWPRMVEGGYILVHDYFSNSYDGAKKAIDKFAEERGVKYIPIGDMYSVAFVK